MFKDYDKYLSTSLKVYIFVLVLVFILKLVGMDYFGLDISNPTINNINNFCLKYHLDYLWYFITLTIYAYVFVSICSNTRRKYLYALLTSILAIILSLFKNQLPQIGTILGQVFIIYFVSKVINKKVKLLKVIILTILNIIFQYISLIVRDNSIVVESNNFVKGIIMNIDYIIMCLILYKVYFMEGEDFKCQIGDHSLSLLKKIHLRKSLKQLQRNLHKFKQLPKQERLSISIYIFLSLLWNTLSLVIILLFANLNHTFIECLFILTSFWLSKHAFGKPFHLPNMIQCFIISNLTYYTLNRITTPLGISIFIPILLGVGLSYVTSKLVKKTYKKLYKGMPKELFDETILKIVDKDSVKYKICYGLYINKKSDLALSFEYNYSIAGIRKIKDRINDKIKELN